MSQADDALAKSIVRLLDDGNERLDPALRDRLLAARKTALSHYGEHPEHAWNIAWAGSGVARLIGNHPNAGYLIAGAALVIALAGIAYWPGSNGSADFTEIDSRLLTDELPINAYLDKGFDSWLKRSLR